MSKRLGKGLDALLQETTKKILDETNNNALREIDINHIITNPNQPRSFFDKEKIKELSKSLLSVGLIEPIIVSTEEKGKYQIIAGERRFLAAQLANFKTIPAIIKNETKENLLEIMLIENIQREDLNPMEEAISYQQILKNKNISHEDLAKKLGKSRSYITNHLRLLTLKKEIQNFVLSGKLSMGHAKILVSLSEKEQQKFIEEILSNNLSVRSLEEKIKENKSFLTKEDAFLSYLENQLREFFQTKLNLKLNKNFEGKLEIYIHGKEDIEKIVEKTKKIE